jgi:hypothetical protein
MDGSLGRRAFLKSSLAMGAAAVLPATTGLIPASSAAPAVEPEWRNRQACMKYRRLGRTGFMVSEVVCGGDPIAPDNHRHVEMAVERGLNYLDTAPAYGQGKSEAGYAEVLRAIGRDRIFLTTKVSPLGTARNRAYLEIFARLGRADQESVLKDVAEDLRQRGATLPSYMGDYFGASSARLKPTPCRTCWSGDTPGRSTRARPMPRR